MNKVEAIILAAKLNSVRNALAQIGLSHISEVALKRDLSKVKIAIIVSDEIAPEVVSAIESTARA